MTLTLLTRNGVRGGVATPRPTPVVPTPPSVEWPPPMPEGGWGNEVGVPYPIPQTAPFNVPQYAITPTPDGTGSALHPGAFDSGPIMFGGHRFWLGYTPYYMRNDDEENPCIAWSDDGFNWTWPTPTTNPLDPMPPTGWNADTDLVYVDGTLYIFWRDWDLTNGHVRFRTSRDGVNWTPKETALTSYTRGDNLTSPTLVFDGSKWHMWSQSNNASQKLYYRTATNVTGPWSAPVSVQQNFAGMAYDTWHLDVILVDGIYRGIFYVDNGPLLAASSRDGVNWNVSTPVLQKRFGWENRCLYRGTIQPHENGTHYRLWYSGESLQATSCRIGYTHIARSLWPNPPD